jgi:hypothetical protein
MTVLGRAMPPPATPGPSSRSLLVWFASPRQAIRTALELRAKVAGARVWMPVSPSTGAEGSTALLCARIPSAGCPLVGRLLTGLGVPVMWDSWEAEGSSAPWTQPHP